MNIHEFQGKQILKQSGVAVPAGGIAHTPEEAYETALYHNLGALPVPKLTHRFV